MTPKTAIPAAGEAVPATLAELPVDRVNRLASQLAHALNDYADGMMHAEIHPSGKQPFAIRFVVTNFEIRDPLRDAIQAYRDGVARFMAAPDEEFVSIEHEDKIVEACYGNENRTLLEWDQPARTREGAIEALKFMKEQDVFVDDFGEPMRRAVLGYLEALGEVSR